MSDERVKVLEAQIKLLEKELYKAEQALNNSVIDKVLSERNYQLNMENDGLQQALKIYVDKCEILNSWLDESVKNLKRIEPYLREIRTSDWTQKAADIYNAVHFCEKVANPLIFKIKKPLDN